MTTLYIDTSSSHLYTGVLSDNELIAERKVKFDNQLSIFTLPTIEEMLAKCNIEPQQVDKILVGNGPGSFTGIRIGVTIAKTWAWALSIPIATLSSLEAMAYSISTTDLGDCIVPIIDARRGYCYAAIFNQNKEILMSSQYISYQQLNQQLKSYSGSICIVSNDSVDLPYSKVAYEPDLRKIMLAFQEKTPMNPHAINPEYLKKTEAEENLDD